MEKRWHLLEVDEAVVATLSAKLGISPILARILYNRGIQTVEEGRHYLFDTLQDLHDPFLMKGMDKAVRCICEALESKKRIVIYGDYDVDGITSTSLLYSILRDLGGKPRYYIPERMSEGYGLNRDAVQYLIDQGTEVLITVDCGISSYDIVNEFKDNLTMIITDHHEPPENIPPAFAVLNPKQPDCPYPFKQLAGAGVAYKLGQALWQRVMKEPLSGYIELTALGTVADVVPLTGENRIIVRYGLQAIRDGRNIGLQALIADSGVDPEKITADRIAFSVAPRLNASGRISHADLGVRLLLERDSEKACSMAQDLSVLNRERQDIEHEIAAQAIVQVLAEKRQHDNVLVCSGTDWHPGVIGIAASRVKDRFYRPSLVISIHDGIGKGSCRSIPGFNMYEALQSAQDLLLQFGGHPMAAGFSIAAEQIDAFRERLNAYGNSHMTADAYVPRLSVDEELTESDITLSLVQELRTLEPYGAGNAYPLFTLRHAVVTECRPIGRKKNHLRLLLEGPDGAAMTSVGWSMAAYCDRLFEGDEADVAFRLEKNEFRGNVSCQLMLEDIHGTVPAIELNRSIMIEIYKALRKCIPDRGLAVWQVRNSVVSKLWPYYDAHTICQAILALGEIGVLAQKDTEDGPFYYFPPVEGKMDLHSSPIYCKYCQE